MSNQKAQNADLARVLAESERECYSANLEAGIAASLQNSQTERAIAASLQNSHQIINVRGDGNCFYYALYGAAKHGGILDIVEGLFPKQPQSQSKPQSQSQSQSQSSQFTKQVREYLAAIIINKWPSPAFDNFYESLKLMTHGLNATERANLKETLGGDFGCIANGIDNLNNKDLFRDVVSECVKTNRCWVTAMEIQMIREHLEKINIYLGQIVTEGLDPVPPRIKVNQLVLVLSNRNHYKYVGYGRAAEEQLTFEDLQRKQLYTPCPRTRGGVAKARVTAKPKPKPKPKAKPKPKPKPKTGSKA